MKAPLWLNIEGRGASVVASLAVCRNCGKTKITSRPCGFDHMAALLELRDAHPALAEAIREAKENTPRAEQGAEGEGVRHG